MYIYGGISHESQEHRTNRKQTVLVRIVKLKQTLTYMSVERFLVC